MIIQQEFDEGMTNHQKLDHINLWVADLRGKGFGIELFLLFRRFKSGDRDDLYHCGDEQVHMDDLLVYEHAVGYCIKATPL
jgi:hypothetical protein